MPSIYDIGKRYRDIEMVNLKVMERCVWGLVVVVAEGDIRLKQHDGKRQDNRFTNNFDFSLFFYYIFSTTLTSRPNHHKIHTNAEQRLEPEK